MKNAGRRVRVYEYKQPEKQGDPWEKILLGEGVFLALGVDVFERVDNGCASYSTAIVEMPDGVVKNVAVDQIEFVEPTNAQNSVLNKQRKSLREKGII